jgi:hypothetical protein
VTTAPLPAARLRRFDAWPILPVVLAVVAEGAWVAAVYAVVCAVARAPSPLGPLGMALAALVGLVAARRLAARLGPRWPAVAVGLVVVTGAVGWLSEPSAVANLLALDPIGALRAHPGGWLAGLACLRGIAHGQAAGSAASLERLVRIGLPGLVVPVLMAGMLAEPWSAIALQGVLVAVVVFLVAATVGAAVARISTIGVAAGFDWRRNRAWLALVALLAVGVVVAVLPGATIVGPVVRIAVALAAVPLFAVGVLAGLGQISARAVAALVFLATVGLLIVALAPPPREPDAGPEDPASGGASDGGSEVVNVAGGGLLLLAVVAGILILARIWMRDSARSRPGDVAEERTIDATVPEGRVVPARRAWRFGRPSQAPPSDAAAAYVALLAELESRESVRREPGESPAEHASRLRTAGAGAIGLDLLAADYELTRFAGRSLSDRETRRAIDRWRRLRASIGR